MSNEYRTASDEFYLSHRTDEYPHDKKFDIHIHDNYEILCFVSGNAEYMVEGSIYSLRPGCIMLMRSAETHKLILNTNAVYERYIINFYPEQLLAMGFPPELLRPFTDRSIGEKNLYLPNEFPDIQPEQFFKAMCAENTTVGKRTAVLITLASLLTAISTAFENKLQNTSGKKRYASDELIDYVNANLFSDLSLTKISNELHISASQVNRTFRKLTGTSIYNYITSKRLIVAQELIAKGENATDASQQCGFHDYSSFYRLYKKRFGVSPTAARKKINFRK